MKSSALRLAALLSAFVLAGCTTGPLAESNPPAVAKPDEAAKPAVHVDAHFLSYAQLRGLAQHNKALNDRLLAVAPLMAYREGESQPHIAVIAADAVGFVAKELVNWLGTAIEDEAKKHSACFAAYDQEAAWWTGDAPAFAAVELTRTKGDGTGRETLFDAIVLIRPVMGGKSTMPLVPAAYQLLPVYLLETTPAAEDFGNTMGAVLSVHLESTWISAGNGDPASAVLIDYPYTVGSYDINKPYLFVAKGAGSAADAQETSSHFFAMPAHDATVSVTFGVAETDPSKWVGVLEKLGTAISGQASAAGAAAQKKASD
jgi:hypothetical protein